MPMLELLQDGMTFDMDPPRWMLEPKSPSIWRVYDLTPMFCRVAPIDRCCIPHEITRASLERCMLDGVCRPVSLLRN